MENMIEIDIDIDVDVDIGIGIGPHLPYPTAHVYGGFVEGARLGFYVCRRRSEMSVGGDEVTQ